MKIIIADEGYVGLVSTGKLAVEGDEVTVIYKCILSCSGTTGKTDSPLIC